MKQVVEQGKQRLASGIWVMIFPEGTRMPAGQTRKYGVSGALLATADRPTRHSGRTQRGLLLAAARPAKKARHDSRGHRPPIDPRGVDPRELNERIQRWIESTVAQLQPR